MWQQSSEYAEKGVIKRFVKRHPREAMSCFENLRDVVAALDAGGEPMRLPFGFYSSEGSEVYRIGQTGVKHPCESRLYIYSCVINTTVYVLTMGDKTTQQDDVNRAKAMVKTIKRDLALQTDKEAGNEE